jgi:two-component system, chemotaxis family, chemotaxis protein CheY
MAKTLLVADDAAIVRAKIKEAAGSAGWEIVGEARNGKEAVDRYVELRPMVTTIDLVMPEYDGIYALREIMTLDPNAKVVVISALGQKNILKDAFKLGAIDFIVKPFDKRALANTLEQLVAGAEASDGGPSPASGSAESGAQTSESGQKELAGVGNVLGN